MHRLGYSEPQVVSEQWTGREVITPDVTIVIPTLAADNTLSECLNSLAAQTFDSFEVIVVDNSGKGLARARTADFPKARVIENRANVGFGAAINQGCRESQAEFIATLNDDATASPQWLSSLASAAAAETSIGMCASQVRLFGEERLDSAGMLICADGSSKQRGHRQAPESFSTAVEALLPSGSAALYRRTMLAALGGFDEDFFLYCEDTDIGLRARWAGWQCRYVPQAVVYHRYSHSAGRASALKAYYVERNRLFVVAKNFPAADLARVPFISLARYMWHLYFMLRGEGTTSQFKHGASGLALLWFVLKAHLALLAAIHTLAAKRRSVRAVAKISSAEFRAIMRRHSIPARQVAAL
jgi:GT2 family glycosyltransferase